MSKERGKLIRGIRYLLKTIWENEPTLDIMVFLCIFTTIVASLLSVYLPSLAVGVIEGGRGAPTWTALITVSAAFVAISIAQYGVSNGRGMRQLFVSRSMLYQVFLRRLEYSYAYTESGDGQQAYEKAGRSACGELTLGLH